MAQARKTKAKPKSNPGSGFTVSGHGIGMLLAGVVMGILGTILWQGMNDRNSDVGSGIRKMIETSRKQQDEGGAPAPLPQVKQDPQSTDYDFYTVLPEIEVVVTDEEAAREPVPPEPASPESGDPEPPVRETDVDKPEEFTSAYMLQAGSYTRQRDAERQKASLALMGLSSTIQKVTIQGRGDFYRVRLGPYIDMARMREDDNILQRNGIKPMRLKVSRASPVRATD